MQSGDNMAEAQALIMYGDGLQALYYDEKNPIEDRYGVMVQPMLVVPSIEIINKYKLTDEDLIILTDDGKHGIWIEYPIKQIDWLNRSKTGALIFIWSSFDGSRTPIMRKMDELLEWDKQRDKTESRLRAQVSTLNRQLEDATSNVAELLRANKELRDIVSKDENDEDDD